MTAEHTGPKTKAFDSRKEFKRWHVLKALQAAGRIHGLRKQRSFPLRGHRGTILARYRADFTYIENGRLVVEDVKSPMTRKLASYRLKKKWLEADYGIVIRET